MYNNKVCVLRNTLLIFLCVLIVIIDWFGYLFLMYWT